jgi:redox-sensing transcriptional repressor
VIRRLPRYLIRARELKHAGRAWASSQDLAEALDLTPSTVRQDISYLALAGVAKRGYEIRRLEAVIGAELGADTRHCCVIVGAGLLGRALALHGDMVEHGFFPCAIFDRDPRRVGRRVGDLVVRPMDRLPSTVRRRRAEIGVIAVPAAAAQEVADRLVAAGIRGILNLAHMHVRVPRRVPVVEARILARLQELAFALRERPR